MGEVHDHLVDDAAHPDGARDVGDSDVGGPVPYEMGAVKAADALGIDTAGQGGYVGHMGRCGHGAHGGVEVLDANS